MAINLSGLRVTYCKGKITHIVSSSSKVFSGNLEKAEYMLLDDNTKNMEQLPWHSVLEPTKYWLFASVKPHPV